MDLVKARERARQKALEEQQAAADRKAREGEGPARREEAAAPARVADQKPARPRKKKEPEARPEARLDREPLDDQSASCESEFEAVFMDDAFGEDLPAMGCDEELPEDAVLGERAAPGPDWDEAGDADEELSWEVKKVPVAPAAKPAANSAPAPKRPPAEAEFVRRAAPLEPARPPEPARRPEPAPPVVAPYGMEPGPGPGRAAVMVDWEEPRAEWAFDSNSGNGDDFYALVTEDLYMREFGRRDEDRAQQLELLSFRLAREVYAVRLTSIKQIIKLAPITMVPRAPEYVLGILSIRGTVIPVFDLRRRLHLPRTEPTRSTRIVVVSEGSYLVGLIVDEVKQVVRISAAGLEPPPSVLAGVEAEYIEGIGRTQNQMIILLDIEKIMTPVTGRDKGPRTGG